MWCSLFADIITALALSIVVYFDARAIGQHGSVSAFSSIGGVPFFLGVAIYAFEGVGMTLPLELSMKDKEKFGVTLGGAMVVTLTLYATFGSMGYFAFGSDTMDIITLNLQLGVVAKVVKMGLCISLFFTFPVMMHPVYDIYERRVHGSTWYRRLGENKVIAMYAIIAVLRLLVVCAIAGVAVGVPHFSAFLALVGSSVCTLLAFVMPALIHLRVMKEGLTPWTYSVDYFLIAFGCLFGLWGTYDAVIGILL